MTKIAFVVQRYGLDINGGAELLCRQVAEHLADDFEIEVLTTRAQDYVTWENTYPAGVDTVKGILVRRFPTTRTRDAAFGERSAWLYTHRHTLQDEVGWLHAQGPVVPDLLQYISDQRRAYAAFVFFTYIYYPTTLGLRLVPDRAILVPTAHDEAPLYLNMYRALFCAPRAIVYNTIEERDLVQDIFGVDYIPHTVAGVGINAPNSPAPNAFRRKYQLADPYLLYVGRVSSSKRCDVLLEYFIRYKTRHVKNLAAKNLTLVLVGREEIVIPDRDDIMALGFVPDEDKFNALAGASLFLMPSHHESLSISFLESLALGVPVLCDAHSAVLRGHSVRSNAGLYYANYAEFEASLSWLMQQPKLRAAMGREGRAYVAAHYTWSRVVQKYRDVLNQVIECPWWSE